MSKNPEPTKSQPTIIAPTQAMPMPEFGLGCASLGNIFEQISDAQAQHTLEAAWHAGVRYYDTSPWYGHGLSEHRLGTMLRQHPRNEYFLSTKVGRVYHPAPRGQDQRVQWQGGQNFRMGFDYSEKGFAASYAQSQLRIGQSSIDALVIHDLDQNYHGKDFAGHYNDLKQSGLSYLNALKASGEIIAIGMGINALEDFEFLAERMNLDFFLVAMPYTLLNQKSLHSAMKTCLERNIKVVIGAPFASGLLADPTNPKIRFNYGEVPEDIRQHALDLARCCKDFDVPLMAAALQFPLLHPAVISIIPGATSPQQIISNQQNFDLPLPHALWVEMKNRKLIDIDAPIEKGT